MPGTVVPLTIPSTLPGVLPADWVQSVEIEHTYPTDVVASSSNLAEERSLLRQRPERALKVRLAAMNRKQSHRLLGLMTRLSLGRSLFPLHMDAAPLTAEYAAGTDLFMDTTLRRFYAGARVLVYEDYPADARLPEVRTISSVASNKLVLTAALSSAHTIARGLCLPLIDSEISLARRGKWNTDTLFEATLDVLECAGPSSLPSLEDFPPAGFSTYEDDPILSLGPDWSFAIERGVNRAGFAQRIGRAMSVYAVGDHKYDFRATLRFLSRDQAWKALRFFDAMKGRTYPFWIAAPNSAFTFVGKNPEGDPPSIYMDVAAEDSFTNDLEFVHHIAIVSVTGAVTIYEVLGKTDNGATWRFTMPAEFSSVTVPSTSVITTAHYCRMNSDSFREKWMTNGICDLELDCIELVNEGVFSVGSLPGGF